MNPLMHTTFTTKLLTDAGIRTAQHELVLGSVVPDLSILGVIPEKDAHERSIEFLDYLSHNEPTLIPFGIGFVLHGEMPRCLDYYTHKAKGYIDQKKESVLEIVNRHKINFKGINEHMLSHCLTEFACDSLAEKIIPKQVHYAFKKSNLPKIAHHMATFFKSDEKKLLKIMNFFKHFNFNKLRTMYGIAHTIQDFMIYHQFANKGVLNTYKYLWVRVNQFKTHRLIKVLKDVRETVQQDCFSFLDKTQNTIYKTVLKKSLEPYI
ncbi:hypothetical protein HY484_02315 [Candidatus Woesearchaeota archaeon]|nr:hypothetical protein [Candidatus Woesearchaeota archaeon]